MMEKRKRIEKRGVNPHRTQWKRGPHQKKKWVDHPVYVTGGDQYVNPVRKRSNGEVRSPIGGNSRKGGGAPRRRRKQERRQKRVDRRSLRWRYGGERGKRWHQGRERTKQEWQKDRREKMTVKGWVAQRAQCGEGSPHRRGRMERRVDRRRWRSGRVETVVQAKERVEKGKVSYRNPSGDEVRCGHHRERRKPGQGRKREGATWKGRKKKRKERRGDRHHAATGVPYVQVDYVAGRRMLVRWPATEEVRIAKGTRVSQYNG